MAAAMSLVARSALLALAIALASLWSIQYTRGPLGFSTLWIASGITTGYLLTLPRRDWTVPLVAAATAMLLVNAGRNGVGPVALGLTAANMFESWAVAVVVSRRIGDASSLRVIKQSTSVATAATLCACGISALFAALVRDHWTQTAAPLYLLTLTWFSSHALGMAIFATLTIAAQVEGRRLFGASGRRMEFLATLALIAVDTWFVFHQTRYGLTFMIFPPLLLCVFRHRFSGFVTGTAIVAIVATTLTAQGSGPFNFAATATSFGPTVVLQVFLVSVCLVAFPMAAVLTERRLLLSRVGESEQAYRLLADHSTDLIGRISNDGTRRYISPSVTEMLGYTPEEFTHVRWDLIHPEQAESVRKALGEVFRTGEDATVLSRVRHRDGHYIWLELNARRVRSEGADGAAELVYAGRDVTRRVEVERELERLARFDTLTGLANRLHFTEQIDKAIARSQRHQRPLALLYLDVDRFKSINDTYGHAIGDALLQQFAERLQACLRSTDLAARLGGDEFVVLAEDLESPESPTAIARKLVGSLKEGLDVGAVQLRVTTSIGIAQGIPASRDELMRRADGALYDAKAAGRDTWRVVEVAAPNH